MRLAISAVLKTIILLGMLQASSVDASVIQADAVVGARGDKLYLQDVQLVPEASAVKILPDGPSPSISSFAAIKNGSPVVFKLNKQLQRQGTINFWIRPEEYYRNGEKSAKTRCEILEIPGVGKCYFVRNTSDCLLGWDWDWSTVKGGQWQGTYVPELPGPEWYHLLYTWDADRGLFDAYLNGTPQRVPGVNVKPWTMTGGDQLKMYAQGFRIADICFKNSYLAPEAALNATPKSFRGKHADLLGERKSAKAIDISNRIGKTLYQSALNSKMSIKDWVMEGPGVIEFKDGWMEMSSALVDGEPKGHIVHWCPDDFPERFVAEWDIQLLADSGFCIVFFAANGEHGEDIFDPSLPKRDGTFKNYTNGAIMSYHISYVANSPLSPGRPTSNLRKNNHFYLISNGPPGIAPGDKDPHKVTLIKDQKHIQLQVDKKVIIDYTDDGKRYGPSHTHGKIGLRHMQWTKARYRNFQVHELRPAK